MFFRKLSINTQFIFAFMPITANKEVVTFVHKFGRRYELYVFS